MRLKKVKKKIREKVVEMTKREKEALWYTLKKKMKKWNKTNV